MMVHIFTIEMQPALAGKERACTVGGGTRLAQRRPAFAARQTVPLLAMKSDGHVTDAPLHFSSTSHGPAAARQTAPELPAGC